MMEIMLEAALRSSVLIGAVWIGSKALRISNPHILMSVWRLVLTASLLMPFVIGRPIFTLPPAALPIPFILQAEQPLISALISDAAPAPTPASIQVTSAMVLPRIDWNAVAASIYLLVTGWLVLRLLLGAALTWRLRRSACPIREDWTEGKDVRASPFVKTPGTFGSTILLPQNYASWDVVERRAIMAHEDSHVRRGDFYILLLASINRAVFWFSPLVWWLNSQIAYLAEARSDAAAIEDIEDRTRYAEILIKLERGPSGSISLAMARSETVARRVEHLLAQTFLPKKMDWKAWAAIIVCILPLAAISSGVVAQAPSPKEENKAMTSDRDTIAQRKEEQEKPRTEVQIDPKILDNYVGYYQLKQNMIFTVTRQGDQFFTQLTGQRPVQVYPESAQKFFAKVVHAQISFVTDPQGRATELVLHQAGREQSAKRIDKTEAQSVEDQLAKRMKDGTPLPGSEAALRRTIELLVQGQPNYDSMSEELALATRQQLPGLQRSFAKFGPLQSISFRGVGSQGWDVYEAKYANGISIWRIILAPDGKIEGLLTQDGP
jgi:beta-lactamase regulating signal transducer with metallopeptidase domain